MTPKEFVDTYFANGYCEYYHETTDEQEKIAKENGLVIVFGNSDDLCEFRGAVNDEVDCFEGTDIYLDDAGNIANNLDDFDPADSSQYRLIKAVWGNDDVSWTYETDIPHETFDVYEDGELYCKGIVFSLSDLRSKKTNFERIKAMTVEEMAQAIYDGISSDPCDYCPHSNNSDCKGEPCRDLSSDVEIIVKWLESEVEEDGTT